MKSPHIIGTCPICGKYNTKLIQHHWYESNDYTVGYIRAICCNCNSILKSNERNHILPPFHEQIKIVKQFNEIKFSQETIMLSIRMPQGLHDKIKQCANKRHMRIGDWTKQILASTTRCPLKHNNANRHTPLLITPEVAKQIERRSNNNVS